MKIIIKAVSVSSEKTDQLLNLVKQAKTGINEQDLFSQYWKVTGEKVASFVLRTRLHSLITEGTLLSKNGLIYARRLYTGTSGLYARVSVLPESVAKLEHLCHIAGLDELDDDLHATLMWCKDKGIPANKASEFSNSLFKAKVVKVEWWSGHDDDGYIVLILDSPTMQIEHTRLTELGCTHSFPDYTPHITLVKNVDDPSIKNPFILKLVNMHIRKHPFSINLGNQRIEDIK